MPAGNEARLSYGCYRLLYVTSESAAQYLVPTLLLLLLPLVDFCLSYIARPRSVRTVLLTDIRLLVLHMSVDTTHTDN